ncbi:Ig-like domain-containing protein [Bacteroidota bacterium]
MVRDGDVVNITATFTETNGITSSPAITIGTLVAGAGMTATGDNLVWTYQWAVTGSGNGTSAVSISATDIAGNANTAATGRTSYITDNTQPTVVLSDDSDGLVKDGDLVNITATFTEVNGITSSPTITIGSLVGAGTMTSTGDNLVWTYQWTITGSGNGISSVSISATDVPGNSNTAATGRTSYTADNTQPTVVVSDDSDGLVRDGDVVNITATFTEANGITSSPAITIGTLVVGDGMTATANNLVWTYQWTVTSSGNGTSAVSIAATDVAGNTNTAATGRTSYTSDNILPTLPTVNIKSNNAKTSYAKGGDKVTLTFNSNEPIQNVVVTIADNTATISGTSQTWDASYIMPGTGLTQGTVPFTIDFTDNAGNTGTKTSTTNSSSVTIDTQVPLAPSKPILKTDNGLANDDEISSITEAVFEGTAEKSATINLYSSVNTPELIGTVTADPLSGSWTITSTTLGEDIHSVTATATDAAGNVSAVSPALSVTIDALKPPTPNRPDLTAGSDSGTSDTDEYTNVQTPAFSGISEPNAKMDLYVETDPVNPLGTDYADGTGKWTITSLTLAEGAHNIYVVATDNAGNVSDNSTSLPIEIDITLPASVTPLPAPDLDAASDLGRSSIDNITKDNTPSFSGTAEVGSVIELYSDATLIAEGLAATGTYSLTSNTTFSSGNYNITVKAIDQAGNSSTSAAALPLKIDVIAPSAPGKPDLEALFDSGTSDSDDVTNDTLPSFSGTTSEANAIIHLYSNVDGLLGSFEEDVDSTSWTVSSTTVMSAVWHNIKATATDVAGNVSPESQALTINIDLVAPAAPIAPDMTSGSDSGDSNVDDITNNTKPSFTGEAEENSIVILYSDGIPQDTGTAVGGYWTLSATDSLSDGEHNIFITATDAVDNTSENSDTLVIEVDTQNPITPALVDLNDASDTGDITDNNTNDDKPSFSGTAEDGSTVNLYSGSDPLASGRAIGGTWTLTSTTTLSDGIHNINITATDTAGNTSTASTDLQVTIDLSAPDTTTTPDLASASDLGLYDNDDITTDVTPTFVGTSEPNATIRLFSYQQGGQIGIGKADLSGSWTVTSTTSLKGGNHSITATATDTARNESINSEALIINVDLVKPNAPSTPDMAIGSDSGSSGDDNKTNTDSQTFTGTAEVNSNVILYSDGVVQDSVVGINGSWSLNTTALTEGTKAITVISRDLAGNISDPSTTLNITIDRTAPDTSTVPDMLASSDSKGLSDADNNTDDATPTFSGTAEAGSIITMYDGTNTIGTGTADAVTGDWEITSITLTSGMHYISVTATDVFGNTGVRSDSLHIVLDQSAPPAPTELDLTDGSDSGNPTTDNITNLQTLTIKGKAEPYSTIDLFSNVDGSIGSITEMDSDSIWSITTVVLSEAIHNITAAATDSAGNTGVVSSVLLVTVDISSPNVPNAPNLDAGSDSGLQSTDNKTNVNTPVFSGTAEFGSTVKLYSGSTEVATGSAADGTWSLTASTLAEGTNSMTLTATDAAGNTSNPSTALEIIVDQTAPATPAAPDLIDGSDTGFSPADDFTSDNTPTFSGTAEAGANVKLYTSLLGTSIGTVTADVNGDWAIIASTLVEGVHEISVAATDTAGNTGANSSALTVVIDQSAPDAPTSLDLADASDSGSSNTDDYTNVQTPVINGVAEPYSIIVLYDRIGGDSIGVDTADVAGNWSIQSDSTLAHGFYNLSASATDSAGNQSSAAQPLAVTVDVVAPVVSSATVVAGEYKVDDLLIVKIITDGTDYVGETVEVNGLSKTLINNFDFSYSSNYKIAEGNNELFNSSTLPVNITLKDLAGLTTNVAAATIPVGSISIDANTPQISSFSSTAENAADGNLIIGDSIVFTLVPVVAEQDLVISPNSYNGVDMAWTTTDGSVYTAVYYVAAGDPEQGSPLQPDEIILSDTIGNFDNLTYTSIAREIYTTYPSATINGETTLCEYPDRSTPINFLLSGTAPFQLTYNNGTEDVGPIPINAKSYKIDVQDGSYTLVNLTDATGNFVTEAVRNAIITVDPLPEINAIYVNSPYTREDEVDTLKFYITPEANNGGTFKGDGVFPRGDYYVFDPSNLLSTSYDRNLGVTYTYTDPNTGCVSTRTDSIYVSGEAVKIDGLSSVYCAYDETVTLDGTLPAFHSGVFKVIDPDSNELPSGSGWNMIDSVTMTLSPQELKFNPGDYVIHYIALDPVTNEETQFDTIEHFTIEAIRTGIQIGGLSDNREYCFDDKAIATALSVTPLPNLGDIGHFFGDDDAVFTSIKDSHNATFNLKNANALTSYTLNYIYTSVNGCIADTVSETIYINPLPEPYFEVNNNYNYDTLSVPLIGNLDNDVDHITEFTGGEIVREIGSELFELVPNNATRYNEFYLITYSATNQITGCYDEHIDTTIIYRAEFDATIEGVNNKGGQDERKVGIGMYCYDGDSVLNLSCTPVIQDLENAEADVFLTGIFYSDSTNAVVQTGPNTADYYFNLAGVDGARIYTDTVYFDYTIEGTAYQVYRIIQLDSVGTVRILRTSTTTSPETGFIGYCNSADYQPEFQTATFGVEQNYTLTHTPKFGYYGDTTIIKELQSISFNPPSETPGTYQLKYSITSQNKCVAEAEMEINIYNVPEVDFTHPVNCALTTDRVPFENLTTYGGDLETLSWEWEFPGGSRPTESDPIHQFESNGFQRIQLNATTVEGCRASTVIDTIKIGNESEANFTWNNDCLIDDNTILTNASLANNDQTDLGEFAWYINDQLISTGITAEVNLTDQGLGALDVTLIFKSENDADQNIGGCVDTTTKTIIVQPYIPLVELPERIYLEDFESGNADYLWRTMPLTEVNDTSLWRLGSPDGNEINTSASGTKAWFTRLTDLEDNEGEYAQVISPCFDLTGMDKPMIKLNIWAQNEDEADGAVLQYKLNFENTWNNLLFEDDITDPDFTQKYIRGIDWFNASLIPSRPGNQNIGWNMQTDDWTSARYSLDNLKDESIVQFRIAYANDDGGNNVDGFAFDDVWIGEREQNVLVEYFTNDGNTDDAYIEDFETQKWADVIPIYYHTGTPVGDTIYGSYPEGQSSRVFYYGITQTPFIQFNGNNSSALANIDDFEDRFEVEALKSPEISIDTSFKGVFGHITLTANEDMRGKQLVFYAALVKDTVVHGNDTFINVLKTFFPDPAGYALNSKEFGAGQTITKDIDFSSINDEMTGQRIILFVQNSTTKEVYQARSVDVYEGMIKVSVLDRLLQMIDVYPNPTTDYIIVESEYEIEEMMILDMTGRAMVNMKPNERMLTIPVRDYKPGIYIIRGRTAVGDFVSRFVKQGM